MNDDVFFADYPKIINKLRFEVIKMSHYGKAAHLGSSLSCLDLIAVLYYNFLQINPKNSTDPLRDRFILSKGHAITSLYAVLAYRDFFPKTLLETFNTNGSCLPEHPSLQCVPGIEAATGSLGHGLSLGLGLALAAKIQKQKYQTVVLLSDGECNEGSIWEAAMLAPSLGLSDLIGIIDYNKWQATGRSNEIMKLHPLKKKWEAFGWNTQEVEGHNPLHILSALREARLQKGPSMIIANTIKGKGIPFMEDDNNWHYRIPKKEEVQKIQQLLALS